MSTASADGVAVAVPPESDPAERHEGERMTQQRWTVCVRDGDLHRLTHPGHNTYGLVGGEIVIIAGRRHERVYLELNGGGYRTECCPQRAADRAEACECVHKYVICDLVWYFTHHLADFHSHWPAWRDQQWDGDSDAWFSQDGLWATMPSTHPDTALICYAGQWLWARVHGDLMGVHGGGPDDYRVTFGWEPQLLNTVWPYVTGFTPDANGDPAGSGDPAGQPLTAAAGRSA